MASSGVIANDECVNKFRALKENREHRFIIFKISDDKKSIEVEKAGDRECCYEDFLNELPEKQGRYALYDMDITVKDQGVESGTRNASTIMLINWCPDDCNPRIKMMMASSKEALKKKLEGIQMDLQASDKGDLDFKEVMEKAASRKR